MLTAFLSVFSNIGANIGANIKTYAIIIAIFLSLCLGGYVYYRLSSDETTIAKLQTTNTQLTGEVSSLNATTQALQTDMANVEKLTQRANTDISTIQTNAAKQAQTIQSQNYNTEAAASSANLTKSVNSDVSDIFNSIQTSSTGTPAVTAGTSK